MQLHVNRSTKVYKIWDFIIYISRSCLLTIGRRVLLNGARSNTGAAITSESTIFFRPRRSDSLSIDYHRNDQSRNGQTKEATGNEHALQAAVLDPGLNREWDADADGVAQECNTGEGISGNL
jgi:hypothetical protein